MRNPGKGGYPEKYKSGIPDFDRISGGIITIETYTPYLNHEFGLGQDRQWVVGANFGRKLVRERVVSGEGRALYRFQ